MRTTGEMGELWREDGGGEDDRPVRSQATDGDQLGRDWSGLLLLQHICDGN